MNLVANGTVRVRDMRGNEWDEIVEVFEKDIEEGHTVEDEARRQAMRQATEAVETLEADIS